MLHLDGSRGEGGGQILRSALGLSLVTGTPFRIERIRAKRRRPGLLRQHLCAVEAAKAIGGARVEGARIGSGTIDFVPCRVRPGDYRFGVGSAGSATLVLQAVLPGLLQASGPTTLELSGGTHNPFAPPFDFFVRAFLPLLARMGACVDAELVRPGFYPAGGGRMRVRVTPHAKLEPLELTERGRLVKRRARALVAKLPKHIAERELEVLRKKLQLPAKDASRVEVIRDSAGPGNVCFLELRYENVTELLTGFGEKGVSAESVARRALREAWSYLSSDAPAGKYLSDQLLIPLALAGEGRMRCVPPSEHCRTNAETIRQFLPIEIRFDEEGPESWLVTVGRKRPVDVS